jgi:hypothetical protein
MFYRLFIFTYKYTKKPGGDQAFHGDLGCRFYFLFFYFVKFGFILTFSDYTSQHLHS